MHSRAASTDIQGAMPGTNGERIAVSTGDPWRNDSSGWDLADQLVKMKLNGAGGDELRTPPSRTMVTSAALEASPLDTASDASSRSPDGSDLPHGLRTHSRDGSADTTGSRDSANHTLHVPPLTPPKPSVLGEHRERPHSYSGGFAPADLKRLRTAGEVASPGSGETTPLTQKPPTQAWGSPNPADQPSYPSLALSPSRGTPQPVGSMYAPTPSAFGVQDGDVDYNQVQQRQFSPAPQVPSGRNSSSPSLGGAFGGRPHSSSVSSVSSNSYNMNSRPFSPPMQVPGQSGFPYPGLQPQPGLSLGNEMMLPLAHENPAVARIQQQHGAYRPNHQYSTSDPASLRDAAALALVLQAQAQAGNMSSLAALTAMGSVPPFAGAGAGAYPPPPPPALSLYGNGFYGAPQDAYAQADLAQAMAARLQQQQQQQQYGSAPYGLSMPGAQPPMGMGPGSAANVPAQAMQVQLTGEGNSPGGHGPSANNRKLGLYKTELCRSWEEKGSCRYGAKCQFAHGEAELRVVARHPKYKTEICRTFWVSGSCPYGKRCCFIHTELPASGAPPGADGSPPPPMADHNRSRSASTNSDPAESASLLARINAKRHSAAGTPSSESTPTQGGFPLGSGARPGGLRVDTSTLTGAASAAKENKSAYPTFQNGMLHATAEQATLSPIAATAHPDFGSRGARLDIGAQPQSRLSKTVASPNNRHSFNGTDIQLDFNNPPANLASITSGLPPQNTSSLGRASGHMRSGSAGNWSAVSRSSRLAGPSYSPIPGSDLKSSSPWGAPELVGSARLS